jgi:hypothetical protein
MVAVDAERLVGSLLRNALGVKTEAPKPQRVVELPKAERVASEVNPDVVAAKPCESADRTRDLDRNVHGDRRPRDDRDRGRDRPRRERNGRDSERAVRGPAPAEKGQPKKGDSREFWEVWSEEVGRTPEASSVTDAPSTAPAATAATTTPAATAVASTASVPAPTLPSGQARLYVNLGRKDGATAELVAEVLSSSGVVVPASDVELMNTHSYVNVSQESASTLCSTTQGRQHNGRAIVCEPARPPKRRF